ncbi:cobB [Symbiodinium microadriaticum]|nr:cobB [Symbiodinium microadriaticum]
MTAFTGAGISVESGIPDFRSPGGLWSKYNPGIYCEYNTFCESPHLFWQMGRELALEVHLANGGAPHLRDGLREAEPNAAHRALVELEDLGKLQTVITQNIDSLHQRAGSKNVIEIHGTMATATCMSSKKQVTQAEILRRLAKAEPRPSAPHFPLPPALPGQWVAAREGKPDGSLRADIASDNWYPKHPETGGVLKPDVTMFGEALPAGALGRSWRAVLGSPVCLVVGTGLNVMPANMVPGLVKWRWGKLIILNLDHSGSSSADIFLQGRAGEVCAAVACGDAIYAIGGRGVDGQSLDSVECYYPAKDVWVPAPPLKSCSGWLAATGAWGGVCVAGGDRDEANLDYLDSVEFFQPSLRCWIPLPPMGTARWASAAAFTASAAPFTEGAAFVAGGYGRGEKFGEKVLSSVECLALGSKGWRRLPCLPSPRAAHAMSAVAGKLYVAGGLGLKDQPLYSVERFDLHLGRWEVLGAEFMKLFAKLDCQVLPLWFPWCMPWKARNAARMGSIILSMPWSQSDGESGDGEAVEADVVNAVRQQELEKSKTAGKDEEKRPGDPKQRKTAAKAAPKTCLGRAWRGLFDLVLQPPPLVEMIWKLLLTVLLYSLAMAFVTQRLMLMGSASEIQASYQASDTITSSPHLRIELTACVMQISVVSGTSVRLFDRTIGQDSFFDGASSKVSLVDTGSCLLVSCLGPASEPGFQVLAHLQVGSEANLSFTSVHLLPGDRSSLLLAGANSSVFGENFSVVGQLGLVQLEYFRAPKLFATLRNGLLDVRYPQVSAAMLDVGGAAVSLRIGRESAVRLLLAQSSELTTGTAIDSTCLSDVAGVPTWNETAGDVSLGDDPNPPEFRILRGAGGGLGALFASRGVLQHERMAEVNTRDSMGTAGFQAESDFTVWASQRAKAGAQVLRLRVVAPGFDDDLGSISARSEWLYSAFGNVYIWHPLSAFYLTTLSIFTPIVSRTDVVLTSTQCTPRVALVTPGDSCMPDSTRYGSYGTDALGGTHMALGQALPEVLSFSNRTASRIYQLRSATTVAPFLPSIADAVVSEFQYSGQSGVNSMMTLNSVGDRGNFMDFRSQAFATIAVIVCLVLPFFITILGYRFYQTEKAKILAADGWRIWPILWQAKQKAMEEVAHFVAEAEAEPTEASEAGRAPEQLEAGAPKKRKGPEAMRENLLSILAKFASESITSVADGVQEVVDQVVDFEMSEAEKDLHSRAEGLLGRSANLLTFVECVVFRRVGSLSFYSDGLVYASLLVILHFGILQALMVPAAAIFLVNSYNITDYQGVYFLSSLLLGELNSSYPLSQAGWIIILTTEVFMLFYTIVEYLCRHIDQVILTQTQLAAGRLSVHRRRLLNLRASRLFRDNMFFLLLIFLHIGITLGIAFSLYLLLGACVTPETVAPVLIGLIATIYVGRRTAELVFSSSRSLQAQLMNSVSDMQSDASTVGEALEETLTELGLNDAQVLLFSLVITGTFACAVAFVLLGSSLFITADSIAPALISGLATVTGALAAARGGAGAEDTLLKFEALKNFNAKVQEVQKFSQQANDAAQAAKDATKQAVEGAEAAKTTVTTPTTPIAGHSPEDGSGT